MSNQIRLKRGSGSDPSASDLVTGEIAIRTDNGKLFTKRDNGNVTEITGGGGIDDGDKGDITVSNSGGTFTIDNGVVNNAKVASNAAIAGSKISPDFGSQDIVTTGNIDLSNSTGSGNNRIKIGANDEIEIFRSGTESVIVETQGNNLDLAGNRVNLLNQGRTEVMLVAIANGGVELYHNNSKKLETDSNGVTISGRLLLGDSSGANDNRIRLGADGDLSFFHSGTSSFILNDTGNLIISNMDPDDNNDIILRARQNEPSIICKNDGAVELYHDDSKKFETTSTGISITGRIDITGNVDGRDIGTDGTKLDGIESGATADQTASEIIALIADTTIAPSTIDMEDNEQIKLGTGDDLELFHNGSHSIVKNNTGDFFLAGNSVKLVNAPINNDMLVATAGGSVSLHHAGGKKFETTSAGAIVSGDMFATHSNGQVECKASDGCIEITRTSGGAFIDFKNSTGEDFDARISENNGGFEFTGNSTINGTLDIGGSSVSANEGGEIHLTYAPNSSLNGSAIVFDQIINSIRFFENGSPHRGFILDFTTAGNGASSTIWHSGNDGAGSGLDADTLDGQQASAFVTTSGTTFSGDVGFSGGAGAANINANSDIRFAQGTWTGEATKIQGHNNYMYIQGGSNGIIFRRSNGTDNWFITSAGHFIPGPNNSLDLGGTSNRIRNIYTNDLNLSNEGGSNDVDGTWGSYTIQEGADDLFLINRRNGKKYKFNLTEVS